MDSERCILTIGYSTRSIEELVALLRAHGVQQLADVRSFPASRRHPHFARAHLQAALPGAGLAYRWMPGLGGRREGRPDSLHTAWRVEALRAYADFMQTPEFAAARAELEAWAGAGSTAVMCAEADSRRCHRQLLADALVVRGWEVRHIDSTAEPWRHALPSFAAVGRDGTILYAGAPALPFTD